MKIPHNLDIEKNILASMLVSKIALDSGMEQIDRDDFYHPTHKVIFGAIADLYSQGSDVDEVTVGSALIGDSTAVSDALNDVFADLLERATTPVIDSLCKKLRGLSRMRKMVAACQDVIGKCSTLDVDPDEIIEESEAKLYAAFDEKRTGQIVRIGDELPGVMEDIGAAYDLKRPSGVLSGFTKLDAITAGWHPTDLIIIAARPAMGKTAFALHLATVAARTKKPVLFASLEMGKRQLVQRILCSDAGVSMTSARNGTISRVEIARMSDAAGRVYDMPLWIEDSPRMTAMSIRSKARKLQARDGLCLIVVDYLQLMGHPGARSRNEEVGQNSEWLKGIAKELNVPVIALSQLSRSLEQRGDKRPMLSDLRESGEIEQNADTVIFLYRDEYYNAKSKDSGVCEVIVGKQRNGPVGTVKLAFEPAFTRFSNLEERKSDGYDFDEPSYHQRVNA